MATEHDGGGDVWTSVVVRPDGRALALVSVLELARARDALKRAAWELRSLASSSDDNDVMARAWLELAEACSRACASLVLEPAPGRVTGPCCDTCGDMNPGLSQGGQLLPRCNVLGCPGFVR